MQNLWIQEASKSGRFTTKKVDTTVYLADLMTKPVSKARIEQLMSLMGYDFERVHRNVSQRRHKDSDVRMDSHITAELGDFFVCVQEMLFSVREKLK